MGNYGLLDEGDGEEHVDIVRKDQACGEERSDRYDAVYISACFIVRKVAAHIFQNCLLRGSVTEFEGPLGVSTSSAFVGSVA